LEILKNTEEVIRVSCEKAHIKPDEIAAIGITNQRETTVVWDKRTGKPYYNAIVWQDTRTKDLVEKLIKDGLNDFFKEKTGLTLSTYFSLFKLIWILDNVPEVRHEASKGNAIFGTIDSYLIWNLTGGKNGGVHVTDPTNASRTMLMNIKTLSFDGEILKMFDIPTSMLPDILPSSNPSVYGFMKLPSFDKEIPITGDLGDQQAALIGQTCFQKVKRKHLWYRKLLTS